MSYVKSGTRPESVASSPEIDFAKCRRNFWWLTGLFVVWFPLIVGGTRAAGIFVPGGLIPINSGVYVLFAFGSFLAFFIQLGRLAAMNRKSRIIWALLPFMFYFIGGAFMYIRMIFLGRKVGWL